MLLMGMAQQRPAILRIGVLRTNSDGPTVNIGLLLIRWRPLRSAIIPEKVAPSQIRPNSRADFGDLFLDNLMVVLGLSNENSPWRMEPVQASLDDRPVASARHPLASAQYRLIPEIPGKTNSSDWGVDLSLETMRVPVRPRVVLQLLIRKVMMTGKTGVLQTSSGDQPVGSRIIHGPTSQSSRDRPAESRLLPAMIMRR